MPNAQSSRRPAARPSGLCGGGMVLAVCLLLVACSDEGAPVPSTNLDLARGESLYEGSCAGFCHGAEASGAPDLFDCGWLTSRSNEEIEEVIVAGIAGTRMVGFGSNFPEGERDHARLIAYIRVAAACEVESLAED